MTLENTQTSEREWFMIDDFSDTQYESISSAVERMNNKEKDETWEEILNFYSEDNLRRKLVGDLCERISYSRRICKLINADYFVIGPCDQEKIEFISYFLIRNRLDWKR